MAAPAELAVVRFYSPTSRTLKASNARWQSGGTTAVRTGDALRGPVKTGIGKAKYPVAFLLLPVRRSWERPAVLIQQWSTILVVNNLDLQRAV